MQKRLPAFLILFIANTLLAGTWIDDIQYLHPLPDSRLVSPNTTIILRFQNEVAINLGSDVDFNVTGNISGGIDGEAFLSSDSQTIIFKPFSSFKPGEEISVSISMLKHQDDFSFSFSISSKDLHRQHMAENETTAYQTNNNNEITIINGVSVPSDFPLFEPSINKSPAEGSLFISTGKYMMILKNDGSPCFYRKTNSRVWDFTVQSEKIISIMDGATAKTMDEHFEFIDSYKCGHGYSTDHHEFKILSNGHTLLIAEDVQQFDMSLLVPGGNENANVVGNHFQELDKEKNVIFEWRCWDHYKIVDAFHQNLKAITIHAVHINAIEIDYDGHYLISSRNLDEITKIDRNTGKIIWRLGGRNNQFNFINDPDGFNYQHDIRSVPGKPHHYTLLDNGNFHIPGYTRAVEYKLDIVNMTAEKIWEYRHNPDYYSNWMGNVQRLPNGNTVIGWAHSQLPKITEVTPTKKIVYEGDFTTQKIAYRVHRFKWNGRAVRPYLLAGSDADKTTLIFNQFGDSTVNKFYIYADTTENPVTRIDSTANTFIQLTNFINLKTYFFRVTSVDFAGNESAFSNEVSEFVNFVHSDGNLILNGEFEKNLNYWKVDVENPEMALWNIDDQGRFHIQIQSTGIDPSDVSLSQKNIRLGSGNLYRLKFDAQADKERILEVKLLNATSYWDYSRIGPFIISKQPKQYSFDFTMEYFTDNQSLIVFNFAHMTGDVFLDNVTLTEVASTVAEPDEASLSAENILLKNYPNPFNNKTTIQFEISKPSHVSLHVYDVTGREILALLDGRKIQGIHRIDWNGVDDKNIPVSSGVYFFKLKTADLYQVNKAILLK